jgi:hypothetical protein
MYNALQHLEAYLGSEYQGILIQSEEPWQIAVVRGLQPVASIPLTPTESTYLTRTLQGPAKRRPLVYFRLALRQGNWVTGTK